MTKGHLTPRSRRVVLAIAVAFAAIELAASALGPYGYFIDELYYVACARRLAWGYVDHPPLSIAILAAVRALLGDSATAIRVPAAIAVAASGLVAARLARRLGGGSFAVITAAIFTLVSPFALLAGSFSSMNAYEVLLWPAACLAVAEIAAGTDRRWWLALGLVLGLGLENKHT